MSARKTVRQTDALVPKSPLVMSYSQLVGSSNSDVRSCGKHEQMIGEFPLLINTPGSSDPELATNR